MARPRARPEIDLRRDGARCPCPGARTPPRDRRRRRAFPTVKWRGSTTRTSSPSTARSSCSAPTTSARSSTTARDGSAPTRSSGTTRRCRPARCMRSTTRTGSSRATASRRSGCCAGCPRRRSSRGGAGIPTGWWNPADYNVASICVPIATHVPHAAGLAWGKRLQGRGRRRDRLLRRRRDVRGRVPRGRELRGGDAGAARSSSATTTAGRSRRRSPTQTRAETLADKAAGYGMPSVRVDGGDVLAVYEATREAVARARAGEGPTFIEAVTYRAAPHATADDPSAYIDPERVEEARRERVRRPLRALSPPAGAARRRARRADQGRGGGR